MANERTGTIPFLQRIALVGTVVVLVAVGASTSATTAGATASALPFRGHGSIGQAYATGAPPGTHLHVLSGSGANVGSGVVDRLGSLVVRNLAAGPGYRFAEGAGSGARTTAAFSVLSPSSSTPRATGESGTTGASSRRTAPCSSA